MHRPTSHESKRKFDRCNGCRLWWLLCYSGVMHRVQSRHSFQWLHNTGSVCENTVPFRSKMPAIYVKQQCDPDHSFFFLPHWLLLKVSRPMWQNLLVLSDANYKRSEKIESWGDAWT